MNNEQILQKIKEEHVKPISRYVFLVKKICIWFLFAVSTMFGAYAFAFFFLKTLYIDFDNWHYFANSYDRFLINNIPIIWIGLFIVSLVSMFYLFKKTNKGYKYSIMLIGFIGLAISFVLGLILAKALSQKGFLVDQFENERVINWTNPESGRLSGEILFVDNGYILLRDIKDDIWNINTAYLLDNSRDVIAHNQFISIIGRYDDENDFTACQIIPLNIDRMRFHPDPKNRPQLSHERDNNLAEDACNSVINGQ